MLQAFRRSMATNLDIADATIITTPHDDLQQIHQSHRYSDLNHLSFRCRCTWIHEISSFPELPCIGQPSLVWRVRITLFMTFSLFSIYSYIRFDTCTLPLCNRTSLTPAPESCPQCLNIGGAAARCGKIGELQWSSGDKKLMQICV